MSCIIRTPLIGPKQQVKGYRLAQHKPVAVGASGASVLSLVSSLAGEDESGHAGELPDDEVLFLEAAPNMLDPELLRMMAPAHTVLSFAAEDLTDSAALPMVTSLRQLGFGLSLRDALLFPQIAPLLPFATHVEISFCSEDHARQVRALRSLGQFHGRVVVSGVQSKEAYDLCTSLDIDAFVENLDAIPRRVARSDELGPDSVLILELMGMVKENADIRQLENVLKRDAALSYRLFHHINSASFGIGVEVQSFRHAVAMLGYAPLYRWLIFLLAKTSPNGGSPVLMQAAIIRGKFAELLGQELLTQKDAENLFVTGMFSLLDRLLGVSMQAVLQQVQLPIAIEQALLRREGIYGPLLALCEVCEAGQSQASNLADALFVTADQVNRAHLTALTGVKDFML